MTVMRYAHDNLLGAVYRRKVVLETLRPPGGNRVSGASTQ